MVAGGRRRTRRRGAIGKLGGRRYELYQSNLRASKKKKGRKERESGEQRKRDYRSSERGDEEKSFNKTNCEDSENESEGRITYKYQSAITTLRHKGRTE